RKIWKTSFMLSSITMLTDFPLEEQTCLQSLDDGLFPLSQCELKSTSLMYSLFVFNPNVDSKSRTAPVRQLHVVSLCKWLNVMLDSEVWLEGRSIVGNFGILFYRFNDCVAQPTKVSFLLL